MQYSEKFGVCFGIGIGIGVKINAKVCCAARRGFALGGG